MSMLTGSAFERDRDPTYTGIDLIDTLKERIKELEADLVAMTECAKNHDAARSKLSFHAAELEAAEQWHINQFSALKSEYAVMVGECAALEAQNKTLRAAQKACEDCDAPTMEQVREMRELLAKARVVAEWHAGDGDECGVLARMVLDGIDRVLTHNVEVNARRGRR